MNPLSVVSVKCTITLQDRFEQVWRDSPTAFSSGASVWAASTGGCVITSKREISANLKWILSYLINASSKLKLSRYNNISLSLSRSLGCQRQTRDIVLLAAMGNSWLRSVGFGPSLSDAMTPSVQKARKERPLVSGHVYSGEDHWSGTTIWEVQEALSYHLEWECLGCVW